MLNLTIVLNLKTIQNMYNLRKKTRRAPSLRSQQPSGTIYRNNSSFLPYSYKLLTLSTSFHPIPTHHFRLIFSLPFLYIFCPNEQIMCLFFYLLFFMKDRILYSIALCLFYLIVGIIPDQFIEIFLIVFCGCIVLPCEQLPWFISITSKILLL